MHRRGFVIAAAVVALPAVAAGLGGAVAEAGKRRNRGGSAYARGNHGYGCVADCSAGTCACSRKNSHIFGVLDKIGYGADTARIAGGAGRWQRPRG